MDWKSLIADLQANGYTQPQIAVACKCVQSTISDLATGLTKQPRFEIGTSLQKLHRKAMAKARREAAKAL